MCVFLGLSKKFKIFSCVYGELFLSQFGLYTIAPAVVIALLEEAVRLIFGLRSEVPPISGSGLIFAGALFKSLASSLL